jgi:hypothetical protein
MRLLEALVPVDLARSFGRDLKLEAAVDLPGNLAYRRVLVIEELLDQWTPSFKDVDQRADPKTWAKPTG